MNNTKQVIDNKGFTLSTPDDRDIEKIADWVTRCGELRLISGMTGQVLKAKDLDEWITSSCAAFIVKRDSFPIAFATLSRDEIEAPDDAVEICHLIVHPDWRSQYNASHLVIELSQVARKLDFVRVIGRVVPQNMIAHSLLASLRWTPISTDEKWPTLGFVWYQKLLKIGAGAL